MTYVYRSNIISSCCNAFTINFNEQSICTKCGSIISDVTKKNLVLDMKYNTESKNNTNNVYNVNLWHDARNWANDETLQLINVKCPACDSFCRFARDLTNEHLYICSNINCRCVYNKHMDRMDEKYKQNI